MNTSAVRVAGCQKRAGHRTHGERIAVDFCTILDRPLQRLFESVKLARHIEPERGGGKNKAKRSRGDSPAYVKHACSPAESGSIPTSYADVPGHPELLSSAIRTLSSILVALGSSLTPTTLPFQASSTRIAQTRRTRPSIASNDRHRQGRRRHPLAVFRMSLAAQ